jgi:hypothetical protein
MIDGVIRRLNRIKFNGFRFLGRLGARYRATNPASAAGSEEFQNETVDLQSLAAP